MNEEGSMYWYEEQKDKFFKHLITALCHADDENTKRMNKVFPQIHRARLEESYDKAPNTDYPIVRNIEVKEPKLNDYASYVEPGTFARYLEIGTSFVTNLARTIIYADKFNKNAIATQFPQIVAAYNMHQWDMLPQGFEYNTYNSLPKTSEKTTS